VAILPLTGQLKEEEAPRTRSKRKSTGAKPAALPLQDEESPVSWSSKVAVGFLVFFIGSIVGTLLLMLAWSMGTGN
jgi:hypothetical protein